MGFTESAHRQLNSLPTDHRPRGRFGSRSFRPNPIRRGANPATPGPDVRATVASRLHRAIIAVSLGIGAILAVRTSVLCYLTQSEHIPLQGMHHVHAKDLSQGHLAKNDQIIWTR